MIAVPIGPRPAAFKAGAAALCPANHAASLRIVDGMRMPTKGFLGNRPSDAIRPIANTMTPPIPDLIALTTLFTLQVAHSNAPAPAVEMGYDSRVVAFWYGRPRSNRSSSILRPRGRRLMDKSLSASHTDIVPGAKAALQFPDSRSLGRQLRVSWHPSLRTIVVSQWRDGSCVASTPIGLAEVPELIGFFVQVMHDAVTAPRTSESPTVASIRRDVRALIQSWLSPRVGSIVAISSKRHHDTWIAHDDRTDL